MSDFHDKAVGQLSQFDQSGVSKQRRLSSISACPVFCRARQWPTDGSVDLIKLMSRDTTEFGYNGFAVGEGSQGVVISAPSVLVPLLRSINELLRVNPPKTEY